MYKKRRKLNKNFEKDIDSSKKNIELVLAKIFDINDEEIQKDYFSAFSLVVALFDLLKKDYELVGFNDESETLMKNYEEAFAKFECEHEI